MISREQREHYLETGLELAGEYYGNSWANAANEFLFINGNTKVLDNVLDIMKELNSGTAGSAVDLFNSQEHADVELELQFIRACHPSGQDFLFHIEYGKEIPGTYPVKDENGNDVQHKMYDKYKHWGHFDKMVETFKQDELNGQHTCAWFNGRLYYSSTMNYNDPYIAMNGYPSPSREEIEAATKLREAEVEALRVERVAKIEEALPVVLSPEKHQEWQSFFTNADMDIVMASAQYYALEVIAMVNRGDDLDDIRQHFDDMDLDRYVPIVAEMVEMFSDDGEGLKEFLITGDRSELDINNDDREIE